MTPNAIPIVAIQTAGSSTIDNATLVGRLLRGQSVTFSFIVLIWPHTAA